ncbi:26S proteasome non-ATPase regulatory subunit 13 [Goodea atripinnis]|uniref:26S proteasome non-ATPase regulatory subunit 13 n=1 Tax=Goodea atripinnis TaxID=208336 RepID=A0ABV0P046_9TELE
MMAPRNQADKIVYYSHQSPFVFSSTETEKQERAFTLGLAGLLGEGVYNFGELLMHPVLESLRNTDKQWLIDTLYAFNAGNVEKFQGFKSAWGQQVRCLKYDLSFLYLNRIHD